MLMATNCKAQTRFCLAIILLDILVMNALSVPMLQFEASQTVLQLPADSGRPTASLPVPNSTRSFWIDTPGANPLAKEGSKGNLAKEADICIIGSGITGVSTAYHLAKTFKSLDYTGRPIKTVILEARDFCSGATGRNGGHLTPHIFRDFAKRELAYGTEEAKRTYDLENYTTTQLVKIIETEGLGDTVDFVSGGHVELLSTEQGLEKAKMDYTAAKAAGMDLREVEWLSKEDVETVYGTSYPAFRFPGQNLWPLKLVTQLYKLAERGHSNKFSLHLHTNTPVTAVSSIPNLTSNAQRWSLSTPRGNIQCSYVIHATNGYASHLLPHMHGPTGIIPTRGQIIALRADAPLSKLTKASWDGNEGLEYWFPRPVNTTKKEEHPLIILGGGREVTGPEFEYYETDDSVICEDVGKTLRAFLPRLFPGRFEEGREPEMEWTGITGYTKLGDPFVGPVVDKFKPNSDNFKGQFVAAGYSGHGMPRTYACAEVVAGMVTAEITGEVWTPPEWLPRHYLTTVRNERYSV